MSIVITIIFSYNSQVFLIKIIASTTPILQRNDMLKDFSKIETFLTVVREMNRPRYPTVPKRLKAQEAPVEVWDNTVLQLDPNTIGLKGSPTWVSKIFSPERDKGEIVGDGLRDAPGTVHTLLTKLHAKDLLPL